MPKRSLQTGFVVVHKFPVCGVAMAPNGKWLATASEDGKVYLFRIEGQLTDIAIEREIVHKGMVSAVKFAPDSASFVTGGADGVLRLFVIKDLQDIPFGRIEAAESTRQEEFGEWINGVSFTPSGKHIAMTSTRQLRVVDANTLKVIGQFGERGHEGRAAKAFNSNISFTLAGDAKDDPDWYTGRDISVKGEVCRVQKYNGPTRTVTLAQPLNEVVRLGDPYFFTSPPPYFQGLDFSWGNEVYDQDLREHVAKKWVIMGSQHPTCRIYDARHYDDLKLMYNLDHPEGVKGATFSPSDEFLATCCSDSQLRIYQLPPITASAPRPKWTVMREVLFPGLVYSATWTPDGSWLITGCEDGHVRFMGWDREPLPGEIGPDLLTPNRLMERFMPGTHPSKPVKGKIDLATATFVPMTQSRAPME